jgi:hypothetical protein
LRVLSMVPVNWISSPVLIMATINTNVSNTLFKLILINFVYLFLVKMSTKKGTEDRVATQVKTKGNLDKGNISM